MSSAGAASLARGMRSSFQATYRKKMNEFISLLESEKAQKVTHSFHLLHYNVLYLPSRFLFAQLEDTIIYLKPLSAENTLGTVTQITVDQLTVSSQKAGMFARINQPSIGEYLKILAPSLPAGKYVIENLEGFAFQDKAKQAAFLERYSRS